MDAFLQLTFTAVFFAGFSGGVHCAAMCGPLMGIACGPCTRDRGGSWLARALSYNAGRIASYAAAGALTGFAGASGLALRGAPLTQQWLLLSSGLWLLLLAAYLAGFNPLVRILERAGAAAWRHIAPLSRRFLPVSTPARAFGFGLVLGWLPCGMVYLALAAALTTADPLLGALVMAAFGAGTLPNVLAISAWLRHAVSAARGRPARALAAALIGALGIFGVTKAVYPAAVSAAGALCLQIPGMASWLGGGV